MRAWLPGQALLALVPRTASDVDPGFADAQAFLKDTAVAEVALPTNPRLVSSAQGTIKRLLFRIPNYAVADAQSNPLAVAYRDLLAKLPPSVEVIVLAHESGQLTVRNPSAVRLRAIRRDRVADRELHD